MPTRKADHVTDPRADPAGGPLLPLDKPLSSEAILGAQQHAVLAVQRFIADERLPQAYTSLFPKLIIPMGAWLLREQQKLGRPLVMGIGGSQGSGKTTLARGLRLALHHCFAVSSCLLSLDDFYKPSEERDRLAEQVHPLLATRGFREPMIWACSWKPWKPCRRPIRTVSRPSRYSTRVAIPALPGSNSSSYRGGPGSSSLKDGVWELSRNRK